MSKPFRLLLGLFIAAALLFPAPAAMAKSKRSKKKKKEDPAWDAQAEIQPLPAPTGLAELKSGGNLGLGLNLGSRTGLTFKL